MPRKSLQIQQQHSNIFTIFALIPLPFNSSHLYHINAKCDNEGYGRVYALEGNL